MTAADRILALVRDEVDTKRFQDLNWTGTFQDYLNKVFETPLVVRNAFQRVYDMIISHGASR